MPLAAFRRDNLEPVDLHELAFEGRRDVIRHRLRACARVIRLYLNDRVIDGRKIVHRQRHIRKNAEKNNGHGQDSGHDRPANEWFGEIHDFSPAAVEALVFPVDGGCTILTFPPGVTPNCPVTTTRSPGLSPCSITPDRRGAGRFSPDEARRSNPL